MNFNPQKLDAAENEGREERVNMSDAIDTTRQIIASYNFCPPEHFQFKHGPGIVSLEFHDPSHDLFVENSIFYRSSFFGQFEMCPSTHELMVLIAHRDPNCEEFMYIANGGILTQESIKDILYNAFLYYYPKFELLPKKRMSFLMFCYLAAIKPFSNPASKIQRFMKYNAVRKDDLSRHILSFLGKST